MTHDENIAAVRKDVEGHGMPGWVRREARKQRDACNARASGADACVPHTPSTHFA